MHPNPAVCFQDLIELIRHEPTGVGSQILLFFEDEMKQHDSLMDKGELDTLLPSLSETYRDKITGFLSNFVRAEKLVLLRRCF